MLITQMMMRQKLTTYSVDVARLSPPNVLRREPGKEASGPMPNVHLYHKLSM